MTSARRKTVRNSLYYFLPTIISAIIPVISLPIYTRYISVDDFGAYALFQAIGIFFVGLSNFGISIGFERNFFEYKSEKDRIELLYSSVLFLTATSLFLFFFLFLFHEELAFVLTRETRYTDLLLVSYLATLLSNLKALFLIYLKNLENAKKYVWYSIDEVIGSFLISFFCLAYLKTGVIGLFVGQLISALAVLFIILYRFLIKYPFATNWSSFFSLFKMSIFLTPRFILNSAGNQIDKYIIGLLNAIGGVGLYSLGQKIGNICFLLSSALHNAWSPTVYKQMFDKERTTAAKEIGIYLTPFMYFTFFISHIAILFSEEAVFILTPPEYHKATDIAIVFSLLYGLFFFTKQPQLLVYKKVGLITVLSLLNAGLNLVLIPLFIKYWGLAGATIAAFLSGAIFVAISFKYAQSYFKIEWEYKKIYSCLTIIIIAAFSTIFLREMNYEYWERLLIKIVLLGVYVYFGFKYKVLMLTDLNKVLSLLGEKIKRKD